MTWSFVVLCASGSVLFGVLFGRLFAWWSEVRDEEQAMQNANIRARFDQHRWDELTQDDLTAIGNAARIVQRPFDWEQAE